MTLQGVKKEIETVALTTLCRHAAFLDIVVRTLLYTLGVAIVLLLEKAFEARHELGGFGASLARVFEHQDIG